jgi:Protein of unknown function, DUF481
MLTPVPGNINLRFLPMGISLFFMGGFKATAQAITDSFKIKGNVSVSGLIQTGNEMRTVASLLSDVTMGKTRYEIEPLTSIAYSTKPGKIVERELLENIIFRLFQNHLFYPALGLTVETSLLRKIDYRWSIGPTIVWNLMKSNYQMIKLGIGYNHEFTQYLPYAFIPPPIPDDNYYSLHSDQIYIRLKGRNEFFSNKLIFTYDFFFQPSIRDLTDFQWTLIGSLDFPVSKKFSIRASAVDSYEEFVATGVYQNNFRLTYGINYSF